MKHKSFKILSTLLHYRVYHLEVSVGPQINIQYDNIKDYFPCLYCEFTFGMKRYALEIAFGFFKG